MLIEIRIHGRGGQGSVVMAELIVSAAFEEGKFGQAFPYLGGGGERRGAPVQAFARISDKPILLREKIQNPDIVIVQDSSLLKVVDVLKGLKPAGLVLLNAKEEIPLGEGEFKVCTLPATRIAVEALGKPIMNTALLGAFAALTGLISLDSIDHCLQKKFEPDIASRNFDAVSKAFQYMKGKY